MTVVAMSHGELCRYDTLLRVERGELRIEDAATVLKLSRRQIFRLLGRLHADGVAGLVSSKRGKPSNRRYSDAFRERVIAVVREHYSDFGPTLAREYLAERHDIHLACETLRLLMIQAGLWKDRDSRRPRPYQPRYRRDCRGELVQIDGSKHWWFEDRGPQCSLLVFIDDATSELLYLKMVETENTFGYMDATREYIERHGKPVAFYSDKHSVFRNVNASAARGDGMTQFGPARSKPSPSRLSVRIPRKPRDGLSVRTARCRIAWSKPCGLPAYRRSRPPTHSCRAMSRSITSALRGPPSTVRDLHRPLAPHDDLTAIMVWREQRTVTSALTLHYNKAMFILEPCELTRALARQRVTVCEYPDGNVEIQYEGRVLPYSVFDKMRQVNQPAVVDNKHLDAALALARQMQAAAPHHRQRNNDAPSRRSQATHIFPELDSLPKIDGRRSGNSKLKRHPRLSDAELRARGTLEFAVI